MRPNSNLDHTVTKIDVFSQNNFQIISGTFRNNVKVKIHEQIIRHNYLYKLKGMNHIESMTYSISSAWAC